MAQKVNKTTKSTSKNAKQAAVPASDLRLRSIGLVLIALGVFAVVSVISHFFNWASDLSALNNDPEFSGVKIPFENACKGAGARVAYWVVDMSFGVFGLIIPIVLMVIGSVPMAIAYPVYKFALNKGKAKYGNEILRLSEELLNENEK